MSILVCTLENRNFLLDKRMSFNTLHGNEK